MRSSAIDGTSFALRQYVLGPLPVDRIGAPDFLALSMQLVVDELTAIFGFLQDEDHADLK